MATVERERRMLQIFAEAVDSITDDFDLIDFLQRLAVHCVELLDVTAAGVMLADERDELQLIAASDEHARLLELFALQHQRGPCAVCHRTGTAQLDIDLTAPAAVADSAEFAERARLAGFATTHALPLRLRSRVVGALNLFHTRPGRLTDSDTQAAQALADVATIAILQQRTAEQVGVERTQLQAALHSRVLVEQAKGVLAERWRTSPDDAFGILRGYVRSHRLRLGDLARQIVDGTADVGAMRAG